MAGFVKLDCEIVTSSLWVERDTRSMFITALVMAEPYELREPMEQFEVRTLERTGWVVPPGWYGFVRAAGVGIIGRDGCDKEIGYAALESLGAPDPDSRSQEYDGRRLVRVDGGYIVLNYFKHRDRDYTAAERMRRLRDRRKALDVTRNVLPDTANDRNAVTPDDSVTANVTHSREQSTESRVHTKEKPIRQPVPAGTEHVVEHYRATHPRRRPGGDAVRAIAKALKAGYTPADCCLAIDGNAKDAWHAERQKHELEYVLRLNKIDNFIALATRADIPLTDDNGQFTPEGFKLAQEIWK